MLKTNIPQIEMHEFELLQKVGLSKTACRCYGALVRDGPLTAGELSTSLNLTVNGLYRVANRLGDQGFVLITKPYAHVTLYKAIPFNQALNNFFAYQKSLVRSLSLQFPSEASRDLQMHNKLEKQIGAGKKLTRAQARVAPLFRADGHNRPPGAR